MNKMTDSKAAEVLESIQLGVEMDRHCMEDGQDRLDALAHAIARLREPAGVGEWMLVPREPTFQMVLDGVAVLGATTHEATRAIYAAMLAAAPRPPAEAQAPTGDDRILWGVVANAGRLSPTRQQRWAHVHDAIAMGSQSSIALCQRFGFDPDDMAGGHDDESGDEAEAQAQGGGEVEEVCHDCRLSTTGFCHQCAVKEDPSAPVGVEAVGSVLQKIRRLALVIRKHGTCAPLALDHIGDDLENAVSALAQQPAAVDGAVIAAATRLVRKAVQQSRTTSSVFTSDVAALVADLAAQPGGA